MMQRILIVPNPTRPNTVPLAQRVADQLRAAGCQPLFGAELQGQFPGARFLPMEQALEACDLLLTVGGDGTILHNVKYAVRCGKPILGVNSGRVGYLAQVEPDEIGCLSRLATGEYTIQQRMLLQVQVEGEAAAHLALNDVVVSKGGLARLVDLEILGDGQPVGSYRADGLIFATPTGSTAYSLSAGGPIVDPGIDTILMTPICPHSLCGRSVLLSPQVELEVRGQYVNNLDRLVLSVDGDRICTLECGRQVRIRRAEQAAQFVQFAEKTFNGILNVKLKSWALGEKTNEIAKTHQDLGAY